MDAATAAGVYIPHLCHRPEFTPHGSCKLCKVRVNGRICSACTFPAGEGQDVINNSKELNDDRRKDYANAVCRRQSFMPGCEKSGNCQLQAVAYHLNMLDNHFPHFYAKREVDASHPKRVLITTTAAYFYAARCQPKYMDGKDVFAKISGRGIK